MYYELEKDTLIKSINPDTPGYLDLVSFLERMRLMIQLYSYLG